MRHWRKVALLLGALVAYFGVFGLVWSFHRLMADFIPLDGSPVGPNIYASFVWVPVAAVAGWVWSDIQADRHQARLDAHHDRLVTSMANLLDVGDERVAQVLDATPGDRQL